jgi:hypothetical protein
VEPPGFLDQGMDVGADWENRIERALATCRVFVPVFSTRYFTLEWCGKEGDAFARRQKEQLRIRPCTGNAIVPVLWVGEQHLTMPPVAAQVQYALPHLDSHICKPASTDSSRPVATPCTAVRCGHSPRRS